MSTKTTETEKLMDKLLGKTFCYYYEGKLIASGIVLGMVSVNAINLAYVFEDEAEDAPGKEIDEIRPVTELKYDYPTKSGFCFSTDNPHYESLKG